jgi:protein TonB
MKWSAWKIGFLVASIVFHIGLLAWLKMPEILARAPQTALVFNLVDKPRPYIPPEPPKEKVKPIVKQDEQKPSEKKEIEKPKPKDEPPPPLAAAPVSDVPPAPGEAVINPEPGGVPGGVAGGTPGGVVGGTGDGQPDVKPDPPPAPEPEPEPKVDVKAIQSQYVASVKSKIYGSKFYPESAQRMEQEGSVKVTFTVASGGGVSGVSVASSSGFSELDNAAVQAVKNAAPFAAIPPELGKSSLTMNITLKYYLK